MSKAQFQRVDTDRLNEKAHALLERFADREWDAAGEMYDADMGANSPNAPSQPYQTRSEGARTVLKRLLGLA
ncbi:MAG: hypothetical protein AAFU41_12220 [Pseudomonadota bacterium]